MLDSAEEKKWKQVKLQHYTLVEADSFDPQGKCMSRNNLFGMQPH